MPTETRSRSVVLHGNLVMSSLRVSALADTGSFVDEERAEVSEKALELLEGISSR